MNELEINRQRAQLLVKARALLNEEYLKNRTTEYEQWQADSNRMWISQGILLPCPNKFTYPTEEAVVARALELYNKQTPVQTPAASGIELPKTSAEMTSSVSARLAEVSQKFTPVILPAVSNVSPWEQHSGTKVEQPAEPEPVATPIDIPLPKPVVEAEPLVEDVVAKEEIEPRIEELELEEDSDEPMTEEEVIEEAKRNSNLRMLLAKFITIAKGLDAKARKDEGTAI
jgi:hypothetical protein